MPGFFIGLTSYSHQVIISITINQLDIRVNARKIRFFVNCYGDSRVGRVNAMFL